MGLLYPTMTDKLPDNVKQWTPDHVEQFLRSRIGDSNYNQADIDKIRNQGLDGRAFLRLSEEKLTRKNSLYELKSSPAEGIMELVEELNRESKSPPASVEVVTATEFNSFRKEVNKIIDNKIRKFHKDIEKELYSICEEYPIKKRRIEQGWKSYTASDGHSVELPFQIIDILESSEFEPDLRINFKTAFRNLHVGKSITLPHLGQEPKHFAEGHQGRTLLVTEQMIDIWNELSTDTYAEEWPMLYIADASDLNVESPEKAGEVICRYFLALNKDILTAAELEKIVQCASDRNTQQIWITVAEQILDLIKLARRKALLIVDEHGVLFEKDPVPLRIHLLSHLMNLNFWGEHYKFARVIFTGTAHARYEREYMKNGQYEFWVIFIGPLQSKVFDILLQLHPVLGIQGIKEAAKKVTNCVPRELIYLVEHIKNLNITNVNHFQQVLKDFEIERVDRILAIAQKYYNDLPKTEKTRYYDALTSMFLPSKPVVQFDWRFLDLGLIYRYKERIIHYLPLCPPAQKALLKMCMSFDLPENIKNQLRVGSLTGEQFEEALLNRLVCKCNTPIQLNVTDLNNSNKSVITLQFNDYGWIESSQLSLGPGNDKVLGRGFNRYSRFDYMLGPIFIQVSISDFASHNYKSSTNIGQAFKPMAVQAGISSVQINGRNQIEMYLDEMCGPGHSAKMDSQNKFVVTRSGERVPGFCIVYIRGSPGTPNHSEKVREFPDVAHVTFEEIKRQLFPNIV
ncbi:5041_t:CDS:2 [Acaulospora morrowiae]|uniref:5041_t:CDS:1 n=1 Tax=Acaulospora morrowiae TaxID=94023 RepID=A0A9N9HG25_9GLOM|nr:5041_t:CDS:2 [Acaulospora morrowiae]